MGWDAGFGRRGRRFAAVVLALVAGLGACRGSDRGSAGAGGGQGGTIVVGMRTDFGGFNPVINTDQYTGEIINYALFTPLIQYDSDLNPRPYLAKSWEMTGDTGVVFTLRDDVRWHDGQPVTARDVAFTFDLAKDSITASLLGSAFLSNVDRAVVVDSQTIRFHFSQPHAQALEDFWWAPLPMHLLKDVAPSELRNADFNRHPVGSGPYRFGSWQASQQLTLDRNPDFPEGLGGPPEPDHVIFRIVPEPSTMMTELVAGNVQVDIPLLAEQAQQVEQSDNLHLFAFPSRTFYYIGWNNRRAPFDDAGVRRAMTLAMDRTEIVDALLHGYGKVAAGPIPPWSPLHPDGVDPLPYDTARAKQLLQRAGWVDRNGDGVRENAAGKAFRFTLLSSDNPQNKAIAEVVQAQLKRVGVDAQVRVLEFQTLLAQHKARDFDAVLSAWVMDNFQVASAPIALFHSKFADVPMSSNRSSYVNPVADSLMEAAAATTDQQSATETWRRFEEVLQQDQPFTFLYWYDELAAARNAVGGVEMDPRGELQSIARWTAPAGS